MLIECENCNKKFAIDENLIPNEGRLLQCGSCNHNWFYKKDTIDQPLKLEEDLVENTEIKTPPKEINNTKQESKKKHSTKSFNIFFVFIITFLAIILLLDTFKNQISLIFPNIENILNNLYQSILDTSLFFKDLFK